MIIRNWFHIVSFISILAISTALIAEFVFDIKPCSMCLKQRYPYYFIILIYILFQFLPKLSQVLFFLIIQFSAIYGLFYSIWHVGIEQKIFESPPSCAGDLSISDSTKEIKEQIMSTNVINCEDVVWAIFGMSAATINTIILILIFLLNAIYMWKFYETKKTGKR
tara:strand:+ start:642 stop:1136 length:495 start_codon:yes stop_codon:yes gene_type:complete